MISSPTLGFNFSSIDTSRIREIVETYGHYLEIPLADKIRVTIVDNPAKLQWQVHELDPLYKEIMSKSRTLSAELQNLASGA